MPTKSYVWMGTGERKKHTHTHTHARTHSRVNIFSSFKKDIYDINFTTNRLKKCNILINSSNIWWLWQVNIYKLHHFFLYGNKASPLSGLATFVVPFPCQTRGIIYLFIRRRK